MYVLLLFKGHLPSSEVVLGFPERAESTTNSKKNMHMLKEPETYIN